MTAQSYVEQVRIFHAIEALKKGDKSILQIALECGYYDHSAFVKRFKKFTGTTPLQFRRSQKLPARVVVLGSIPEAKANQP